MSLYDSAKRLIELHKKHAEFWRKEAAKRAAEPTQQEREDWYELARAIERATEAEAYRMQMRFREEARQRALRFEEDSKRAVRDLEGELEYLKHLDEVKQ